MSTRARCGFAVEIPPFAGIDAETLGALAGTLADAAPGRCTVQIIHWASPRFGAALDAWSGPRGKAGPVQTEMAEHRGRLLAHAGWRPLHGGGPPFTLADYRVFVCAALAGPPGPASETSLGSFRRAPGRHAGFRRRIRPAPRARRVALARRRAGGAGYEGPP